MKSTHAIVNHFNIYVAQVTFCGSPYAETLNGDYFCGFKYRIECLVPVDGKCQYSNSSVWKIQWADKWISYENWSTWSNFSLIIEQLQVIVANGDVKQTEKRIIFV